MGHRTLPIDFTVIPGNNVRTLLGMDFLEANGIMLDLGQRVWYFTEEPDLKYDFLRVQIDPMNTAVRKIDFEKPDKNTKEPMSDFLKWASNLKMLSPIPGTPPGLSSPEDVQSPKPTGWKLIKLDTPPPLVRPREPRGIEDTQPEDPRVTYIPINPLQMYSIDISLQPHEGTYLSHSEKEQFNKLLDEYQDIFNEEGDPTPLVEHKIETGNHRPIALKPYRLSPIRQQQLKEKLDVMLKNNIIEECESPWAAPVVLVPKGDSDIRAEYV
jgi:hypothetical protein